MRKGNVERDVNNSKIFRHEYLKKKVILLISKLVESIINLRFNRCNPKYRCFMDFTYINMRPNNIVVEIVEKQV